MRLMFFLRAASLMMSVGRVTDLYNVEFLIFNA